MRKWLWISLMLFIGAIVLLAYSVTTGEGQAGLFLIFPFITAWGPIAAIGALLLFGAIISLFIGFWTSSVPMQGGEMTQRQVQQEPGIKMEKKYGGVVLLGPIPIAFGSDQKIAKQMLIIGVVIFAILLAVFLIFIHPF